MHGAEMLTLAIAVASLTLKPGPGMILLITHTVSDGLKGCIGVLLGAQLVNMLFLAGVFIVLNQSQETYILAKPVLQFGAGSYLLYASFTKLKIKVPDIEKDSSDNKRFVNGFISSSVLTASNPLVLVFYSGILPTVMDIQSASVIDLITICTLIFIVEVSVAASYALPLLLINYKLTPGNLLLMTKVSNMIMVIVSLFLCWSAVATLAATGS